MTSARGLSLASITRSTICTTGPVARTVIVLAVLFGTICGCTAWPATRTKPVSSCDSSVASECEMKKVRMTCSSYCTRFAVLSVATMMVRSFSTL